MAHAGPSVCHRPGEGGEQARAARKGHLLVVWGLPYAAALWRVDAGVHFIMRGACQEHSLD